MEALFPVSISRQRRSFRRGRYLSHPRPRRFGGGRNPVLRKIPKNENWGPIGNVFRGKTLLGSGLMSARTRFLGMFLSIVFFAYPELAATAQSTATTIDIGEDGIGATPAEFDVSKGRWKLVRDPTAKAGLALEQSGVQTAEERLPLAIYKTASIKNAEISLRLKADGGESDRGGGIAVRLSSPQDYYLVQVDALRDRVLFFRVSGGASEEIAGVDADIASHSWHTLTVRAVDDEFTVSLDGAWVFTVFDKALSKPGRIALWAKGDSVTRFDSIVISALSTSQERY